MGLFRKKRVESDYISQQKSKIRLIVVGIFILAIIAGSLNYPVLWDKAVDFLNNNIGLGLPHFYKLPFRLGLDLQGGTVAEPIVQINKVKDSYRLIVELPGVRDIHQAIEMIGETPYLEFKEQRTEEETEEILKRQEEGDEEALIMDPYFKPTPLTGRYLKKSQLTFEQTTNEPYVALEFDKEGGDIFAELTKRNIDKLLAIYLDGVPISIPRVQEEISGGRAQITGEFTLAEAKELAQRLNAGALPVPITLIGQQSIGASLGQDSLFRSLRAAIIGLIAVALFMIIYYRVPGILAVIALAVYAILVLAIFKLIPVTLTLAGMAGFILSVGMAVDANVLIFERVKEERKAGRDKISSINKGFKRAWPSIRDGNVSTLITAIILYWFGTSIIKGFALTLLIGILISMFTAIVLTRHLLKLSTSR
jgi:protein-export membrane protein SecD